ncbi:MAG: HD domain-containing protein [Christensenellaceae bacterium]|jgi:3'-5' exoribonuclease|nr:HD domain-containing protein [Christensenellaceae bacterium]
MQSVNLGLRHKDESVEGIVLLKGIQQKISSNGSPYLDLTVMDRSGEMNAKVWNLAEGALPVAGSAIKIRGLVHEFMGKLQLRIDKYRAAAEEEIDWAALVPCAPEEPEALWQELYEAASGIREPGLRAISRELLSERKEKLLIWPAAVSYHHAMRTGLLQHSATMLRAAKALFAVYPDINPDLVVCGVIAHDMSKIDELAAGPLGLAAEYSAEGLLLGHLALGVAHVREIGLRLGVGEEVLLLVEHMVLSHHENPEYGSPRPPMFPEAELLHQLDVLDARLFEMRAALAGTPDGGFSERVRSLENRRLYRVPRLGGQEEG